MADDAPRPLTEDEYDEMMRLSREAGEWMLEELQRRDRELGANY